MIGSIVLSGLVLVGKANAIRAGMTLHPGAKITFSHPLSNGGMLRYSATIVKLESDSVWVEIPPRVRRIPFPPVKGKRYARYLLKDLAQ